MGRLRVAVAFILGVWLSSPCSAQSVYKFQKPCAVDVRERHGKSIGPWLREPQSGLTVKITRITYGVFDLRAVAEGTFFTSYVAELESQTVGEANPDVIALHLETRVDRMASLVWAVIGVGVGAGIGLLLWRKRQREKIELDARYQEAEAALSALVEQKAQQDEAES